MDMIMIDITDLENININDDVYLFDNEEITVEELAKIADTINYEIISTISFRVDRIYINE
jgi:alanine racemase